MAELIVVRANSVDMPERAETNGCISCLVEPKYIFILYYLIYLLKVLPPFSSSLFVLSAN